MKQTLIVFAFGALLMGTGVVVGTQLDAEAPASAQAAPELLRSDAPAPRSVRKEPELLGTPAAERILARLARLEEQVGVLVEQQKALTEKVEPAAWVAQMLKARMPAIDRSRLQANQTAALATARNCISAQAQMQATGKVDTDGDGTGEYAGFRELSGATAGRMSRALVPPVLSGAFRVLSASGEVSRYGYLYRLYLPGPGGEGIGEPPEGFTPSSGIDSDLAETTWCLYAWPADPTVGTKVFFTNQGGDVLVTEDPRYVGTGKGPEADAAFQQAGAITGAVAIGTKGADGNLWKPGG